MISEATSKNQISLLIYKLFHPTIIVFFTPLIIGYFTGGNLWETIFWTVLFSIVFVIPIYLFYKYLHNKFLTEKNLHTALGAWGFLLAGMFVLATTSYSLPQSFLYCSYTALIGCAIGTFVTRFINLSPHTVFLAGCSTIALISSLPASLIIVLVSCLSGWSVLQLNKTNERDMIMTIGIVTLCVIVAFNLLQ